MSAVLKAVPDHGESWPTCGEATRAGSACRRRVKVPSDVCPQHEPEPLGVAEAAGESTRALLTALRDRIASDIDDGVAARDLASLSKRLLDISKELEALKAAEDGDDVSEAAKTPDEPWGG